MCALVTGVQTCALPISKGFSTYLGIPISETDGVRVGLGISSNKVNLFPGYSPRDLIDYQNQLGNKTIRSWTGTLGWNHDTRNGYWEIGRAPCRQRVCQ